MKALVQAWKKLVLLNDFSPSTMPYQIPLEPLELILGTQPKSFSLLQKEFDLPSSEYFTFLRIQHCLRTIPLPLYAIPPLSWQLLTNLASTIKGISHFYNLLHKKNTFTKMPPNIQWEADLAHCYSDKQWQCALQTVYRHKMLSSLGAHTETFASMVHDAC